MQTTTSIEVERHNLSQQLAIVPWVQVDLDTTVALDSLPGRAATPAR